MNANLIGAGIGALLTVSALIPNNLGEANTNPASPVEAAVEQIPVGNLLVSTVPANPWILVTDYTYMPHVPPQIDLTGWPQGLPLRAVVRDSQGMCIGRLTDESGQLRFIFVEVDIQMCREPLPGPANLASKG